MSKNEFQIWLSKFSKRVLRERGTPDRAATPLWTRAPANFSVQLHRHLKNAFAETDQREVEIVQSIRAISAYGGKSDLITLLSLSKRETNPEVLCAVMDAALCIGGPQAVQFLNQCVQRYEGDPYGTLSRVATYDYDRLLADSYDMTLGPPAAPALTDVTTEVAISSLAAQFDVCTFEELSKGLARLAPDSFAKLQESLPSEGLK